MIDFIVVETIQTGRKDSPNAMIGIALKDIHSFVLQKSFESDEIVLIIEHGLPETDGDGNLSVRTNQFSGKLGRRIYKYLLSLSTYFLIDSTEGLDGL